MVKSHIKLAEEKSRISEIKFHAICASAQDAIIMIDNEGRVSCWNEAAEKMFGHTRNEVTGKEIHELIMPERFRKRHQEGFKAFQDTGAGPVVGKAVELAALRKDGNEFPIELSVSAMQIRGEWHATGIIKDITGRRQAEEGLKRRRFVKMFHWMHGLLCPTICMALLLSIMM
jgi:PAS domain S-box-containing protein